MFIRLIKLHSLMYMQLWDVWIFLNPFSKSITHLIDIKAIPTNTALTASLRPAYSNACGSISYSVRKAITPPTVKKRRKISIEWILLPNWKEWFLYSNYSYLIQVDLPIFQDSSCLGIGMLQKKLRFTCIALRYNINNSMNSTTFQSRPHALCKVLTFGTKLTLFSVFYF